MQREGFSLHEGGHLSMSRGKFAKYPSCVGGNVKLSQNTAQTHKAKRTAPHQLHTSMLDFLKC